MNSGSTMGFLFDNRKFLASVVKVLGVIISEGGIDNQKITINVQGNTISGDANFLNDLKLKAGRYSA